VLAGWLCVWWASIRAAHAMCADSMSWAWAWAVPQCADSCDILQDVMCGHSDCVQCVGEPCQGCVRAQVQWEGEINMLWWKVCLGVVPIWVWS
jgi:hypothetical protein